MSTRTRRIRRRRKRAAKHAVSLASVRSLMSTSVLHHAAQVWVEPNMRVQVDEIPGLECLEVRVSAFARANRETHFWTHRVHVPCPGKPPRRLRWLEHAVKQAQHALRYTLGKQKLERWS